VVSSNSSMSLPTMIRIAIIKRNSRFRNSNRDWSYLPSTVQLTSHWRLSITLARRTTHVKKHLKYLDSARLTFVYKIQHYTVIATLTKVESDRNVKKGLTEINVIYFGASEWWPGKRRSFAAIMKHTFSAFWLRSVGRLTLDISRVDLKRDVTF